MPRPEVRQTVRFAAPVTGTALMNAVKKVASSDEAIYRSHFAHQQGYMNGPIYIIGQRSHYRHKNLVVAASVDAPGIRLNTLYQTVEIIPYRWSGITSLTPNTPEHQGQSVRKFANMLLAELSEPSLDSVWPQEIEACSICQRLVSWQGGQAYCPVHKQDAPTRMIKVIPAPE